MVNEAIGNVAATAAKGFGTTALLLLRVFFWSWIVILFFLSSIVKGIEARDISVTFIDLGNRFLLVSNNLNVQSLEIINNGLPNISIFSNVVYLSEFISCILIIFLWLKLFSWIIGHTPFSNTSNIGKNYLWAFVIFMLLQIFASLINAGITGNLTAFTGESSALYYILLPFTSILNFFKAFYIVIKFFILKFNV